MTEDKPGDDGGAGFLSRWSRRKQQVARGAAPPERAEPATAPAAEREQVARDAEACDPPPASTSAVAEPEIDLSKLPKLDDLTADTDYTQFLARGVPEELRTAALRRAWTLDPKIRDFIEVAENQWDFNAPDGVPGFGELAPGTKLDALLAQAIGQSPAPEPAGVAVAAPHASPDPVPAPDVAPHHAKDDDPTGDRQARSVSQPADDQPARAGAALMSSGIPSDAPDAPNEQMSGVRRRRHGGALPA